MKNCKTVAILMTLLWISSVVSFAQAGGAAAPTTPPTIASVLNRQLGGIEREIMNAVDAIPEDKFNFSPATGNIPGDFKTPNSVRTMAEQFKHIGDALEGSAATILGQKHEGSADENGPKNVTTKADVLNYLKAQFAKAHGAIDTINQQNAVEEVQGARSKTTRLAIAVGMIAHSNNHYGQIIEYMRMNGIVPPESRPRS
jgi:hypothetical protein